MMPTLTHQTAAAMSTARRARRGFTLMELMVAIGITLILLLFVNGIFRTLSQGVTLGMATSDIVQKGRIVSEQIADDANAMVGPRDNGVLIITNQWIPDNPGDFGVAFTESDDPNELDLPLYHRRADQIMFIRKADDLEPMTPTYLNYYHRSSDLSAAYARVTYGHALRFPIEEVTQVAEDYEPWLGDPVFNEYAAEWILGRQAMLLATDIGGSGSEIFGYSALYDDLTEGVDDENGDLLRLYWGFSDVAWQGLYEEANKPDDTWPARAMVGDVNSETDDDARIYRFQAQGGGGGIPTPPALYAEQALPYTYALERLRVNPTPLYDPAGAGDGFVYQSWHLMQTHPILASGITDFIVEFAGDYDDAGHNQGGRIDMTAEGEIRWYGIENNPITDHGLGTSFNSDEQPVVWQRNDDNGDPFTAFIFRHGDGDTNWPHMIRIRYRVMDPDGRMEGADGLPGRMYEQIIRVPR